MKVDIRIQPEACFFRCYLDGEDISKVCFAASEEEGWADCYMTDGAGRKLRGDGELLTGRRQGTVQLVDTRLA